MKRSNDITRPDDQYEPGFGQLKSLPSQLMNTRVGKWIRVQAEVDDQNPI